MTLKELQRQVNELVEANDVAGNGRNEMQVCVMLRRNLKVYKVRVFEIDLFYRGQTDIGERSYGASIIMNESSELK